jgi:hypothetical protein
VRAYRADPNTKIYVVVVPEAEKAINILKAGLGRPNDDYEDLGRVSEALLNALSLQAGTCTHT